MKSRVLITVALLITIQSSNAIVLGREVLSLPNNLASDADREAIRNAIGDALENQPDGKTTTWNNPETGSKGMISTDATHTQDGMTCRTLRLRNYIEDRTNDWAFTFCKTQEGNWKVGPAR